MRIDGPLTPAYGAELFGANLSRRERHSFGTAPAGSDRVSVSDAAREAYAASRVTGETAEAPKQDAGAEARKNFADYLKEARGEVSSTGANPVETLKKMIEKLQKKMESTAKSDLPPETKQALLQSLDDQISALQKELTALISPKA